MGICYRCVNRNVQVFDVNITFTDSKWLLPKIICANLSKLSNALIYQQGTTNTLLNKYQLVPTLITFIHNI